MKRNPKFGVHIFTTISQGSRACTKSTHVVARRPVRDLCC